MLDTGRLRYEQAPRQARETWQLQQQVPRRSSSGQLAAEAALASAQPPGLCWAQACKVRLGGTKPRFRGCQGQLRLQEAAGGGKKGRRPASPLSPRPHPPMAGRGGLCRLQHQLFQGLCSLCGALGLAQAATNAKSSPLCHLPHPAVCTGVTLCAPGRTGQPLCLSTRSSPCC